MPTMTTAIVQLRPQQTTSEIHSTSQGLTTDPAPKRLSALDTVLPAPGTTRSDVPMPAQHSPNGSMGLASLAPRPVSPVAEETQARAVRPGIWRIVLTGGPCGGKTTGLAFLERKLRALGYETVRIDEAASRVAARGFDLSDRTPDVARRVQHAIVETQLRAEDEALMAARRTDKPTVILMDRGLIDAYAYASESQKPTLLRYFDASVDSWMQRYDAVLHFQTAAVGASTSYTLQNNPARKESIGEAERVDTMLKDAWAAHPHQVIVDSGSSFEAKLLRAFTAGLDTIDVLADEREVQHAA